jgi:hypothetical protein
LDDDGFGALNVALERSHLYIECGHFGEARAALEWAWHQPITEVHPIYVADLQVNIGRLGLAVGPRQAAVECFREAVAAYERLGNTRGVGRARRYLGQALGGDEGKRELERSIAILDANGDTRGVAMAHEALAVIAASDGNTSEATRLRALARDGYSAVGDERAAESVGK